MLGSMVSADGVVLPDLLTFLRFLFSPEGLLGLGGVVSWALSKWAWYNQFTSDFLKRVILGGIVAVLGIAAYLLATYVSPDVFEALNPFWFIVGAVVLQYVGSQAFFQLAVKNEKILTVVKKLSQG